ncbi:Uncharacterised protein [Vibrio cholerae]|nr:Uncharacterised protein [Vibrio cholerae]
MSSCKLSRYSNSFSHCNSCSNHLSSWRKIALARRGMMPP